MRFQPLPLPLLSTFLLSASSLWASRLSQTLALALMHAAVQEPNMKKTYLASSPVNLWFNLGRILVSFFQNKCLYRLASRNKTTLLHPNYARNKTSGSFILTTLSMSECAFFFLLWLMSDNLHDKPAQVCSSPSPAHSVSESDSTGNLQNPENMEITGALHQALHLVNLQCPWCVSNKRTEKGLGNCKVARF